DNNPPDAHGKTGTTQDHRDVWFDGFTKKLVCIVWAGHPTTDTKGKPLYGLPMTHEAFGATITAPIWKRFMVSALAVIAKEEAKHQVAPKAKVTTAAGAPDANKAQNAADTNNPDNATAPGAANTNETQPGDQTDPFAKTGAGSTNDTTSPNASTPANGTAANPTGDNTAAGQGGTVSVWIDDATGLRAPPNAPGAHQETFQSGTEPTAFAPGYANSHAASTPNRAAPAIPNAENPTATPASRQAPPIPTAENTPSPPRHTVTVRQAVQPPPTRYVTVTVCAETGLRATKWCPETIDRVFPVGQAPKRYCSVHRPPPGER
ncbi:MAG TPA: hypothetical protein VFW40_05940, partial [Capsulimonadaceae bacterium]|nr:hypothetical protein [Capsulimonadaceae bacterium]